MSAAALDGLIAHEEALIAALDAGDLGGLEQAVHALRGALSNLVAVGGWHASPDLKIRLSQALRLAEAAGGRVNYLADDNRRRIDRLASVVGQPRAQAYGRTGRFG